MTHWRLLMDQEYLHEYHLQGKELTVTIEKVTGGELVGNGGKKARKPVLHLKGLPEGLPTKYAVGAGVCKVIEKVRTKDYENWPGLTLVLYPAMTTMAGEDVACIRAKLPKEAK